MRRLFRCLLFAAGSSMAALAAEPAALFAKNCGPCHGKDGKAQTPMARKLGVKDLTRSKISDADIRRQIRDGRKDPKGKTEMPAFKDALSAEEIKLLIDYIKTLRK